MNSPEHRGNVLIAGLSGRALAELAHKAGYRPLVVDLFGDMDTRRYAHAVRVVPGTLHKGPDARDLASALAELSRLADAPPIGLVVAAGFEHRPALLDNLARSWGLLGCPSEVVERAKNPAALARACAELEIPHPPICFEVPDDPDRWVAKRVGGSGGWHIGNPKFGEPGVYFQRKVAGAPVSVLVVSTGQDAAVIGWSAQWSDPIADVPYRWAGAAQPARLEPGLKKLLTQKALELALTTELAGLASFDFVVEPSTWHLLEINPRPGGTLDIFDDGSGRLFEMHIQACRGRLLDSPTYTAAQASVIAFAERVIYSMPDVSWPDWCADLQSPGTRVEAGAPVCTIRAAAGTVEAARDLVEQRRDALLRMVCAQELAAC